jgi:transcriptional regulator with XRE-family HTH domain
MMMTFGKRLKHHRLRAGYSSAAKFGEEMGILPVTYRTYEAGKAEPGFDTLLRICRRLGITPNDLFSPADLPRDTSIAN